jgi:hypothetical protein
VRPHPPHGEGADGDQCRPVQNGPRGSAAVQERYQDGDHDGCAADEDARYGGLRGALGGEHGEVEADQADGGQGGEADPRGGGQGVGTPVHHGQEEQAGEPPAEDLAARVRAGAEDAVGGEGGADEDAGEGREEGAAP